MADNYQLSLKPKHLPVFLRGFDQDVPVLTISVYSFLPSYKPIFLKLSYNFFFFRKLYEFILCIRMKGFCRISTMFSF